MTLQRIVWSFLVCGISVFAARGPEPGLAEAKAALARLPLRFEANQGQWAADIRYAARTGGGALLLTKRGAVMLGDGRRVEITMVKANASARIEALDPMRARTNYFVGSREKWRTGVENFTRVAYRSVYPGIDVVYYGNGDQLEYDFVLQPGADPRAIRLQFRGAERVKVTAEGDLSVDSGGAQFVQKRPVVYQEDPLTAIRRPVEGRYELLARGVVGLRLSAYDVSRPLVIDPVVTYSLWVGGGSTDVVNAITTDSQGLIYIGGYTRSGDLASANAIDGAYTPGGTDGFVAVVDPKLSGGDTWLYFSYVGGGRDDAVTGIVIDVVGNIDLTGTTTSSDFPINGASVQTTLALSTTSTSAVFPTDAFVTIISMKEGLQYSTYYGGTANETPAGIARDNAGRVYILGTTTSPDLPVTPTAIGPNSWGPSDVFLAVMDPGSTTLVYATYLGGESSDDARGMAVSPNGLVYFAASSYSQQFPITGNAYQPTLRGLENLVIGVIDPTQVGFPGLVYCTYFGGSGIDEVRKMSLDANGKLLLTGWTLSRDFPTTANALQPALAGAANAFVARVNPSAAPSGFVEYSSFLGGSVTDVAYDIKGDAGGNINVTGYTMSPDFPVTPDAVQPAYGNGIDAFLVKLNPAVAGRGALVFGTYFGGVGTHVGQAIVLGANGSVYLGGYSGPDMSLAGAHNFYNGGSSDGFVAVIQ
jgi:hypothetical protein